MKPDWRVRSWPRTIWRGRGAAARPDDRSGRETNGASGEPHYGKPAQRSGSPPGLDGIDARPARVAHDHGAGRRRRAPSQNTTVPLVLRCQYGRNSNSVAIAEIVPMSAGCVHVEQGLRCRALRRPSRPR